MADAVPKSITPNADTSTGNSTDSAKAYLTNSELVCGYGERRVVDGISFSLQRGEIGCILGPSGCGKTTALRAIAGFVKVMEGVIRVNDRVLSSSREWVAPEKRNLGMVYQDYALFPHLNVEQNIGFGLHKKTAQERQAICDSLLQLIQMQGYGKSHPAELSGGQQQRVALARSLAVNPDILLLDEPFSGLDVELRRELSSRVRAILKERGTTALLVTHDQEEAFAVADKVGVMQAGKLLQWDTPYNLYHRPRHRFVADFVGRGCFIRGHVLNSETLNTELGAIQGKSQYALNEGQQVELLVRPDDVLIDDNSQVRATIIRKLFVGTNTLYGLKLSTGTEVETMLPSHEDYEIGTEHGLRVETPHLITFELGTSDAMVSDSNASS